MCVCLCRELVFRNKIWRTARMCWGFLSSALEDWLGQGDFCTGWQDMFIYHCDPHTIF